MTPETFLKEFGRIANAPGGVQRLREMILQLAVMGKLVPQNPEDEPAGELLQKISSELSKEWKLNPDTRPNECDIDLAPKWICVRLGSICLVERGGSPRPIKSYLTQDSDGLNWIKIGDTTNNSKFITSTKEKIKKEGLKKTRLVFPGDFLLTNSMSFGRPYITQIKGCIHDGWLRISPPSQLDKDYLYLFLSSPYVNTFFRKAASGGVVKNLNTDKVRALPILLPPFAEQTRIATKVDQLMALCDRLEAQQQKRATLVQQARISALDELANAQGKEALQTSWKRLQTHLSMLFDHPDDVEDLKKCILQNAVMGKLVPQNPDDEPASELLKRINNEKNILINKGKIKKTPFLSSITEREKQYNLPKGWEIIRFGNLANEIATGPFGSMIHKRDYIEHGVPLINPSHMIDSKIVEDKSVSVTPEKADELKSYFLHEGDIVMARRGEMGRCALVTKREAGWLCGTGSFVLRFNNEVSRKYILLLFRTERIRGYLGGNSVGTTMTNLNHGILNKMPVLLPPISEQTRIIRRTQSLLNLCNQLQKQLAKSTITAEQLAQSIVETITGQSTEKTKKMKAPKTELVSRLKLVKKPGAKVHAPLSAILVKNNEELSAKTLWNTSGLAIDDFYRQLKTEMVNGWIAEPEKAHVRIIDDQGTAQ